MAALRCTSIPLTDRRPTDRPLHSAERTLASDLLHDRDGALADERDGHRVGTDAVARDAAGGVGGVSEYIARFI